MTGRSRAAALGLLSAAALLAGCGDSGPPSVTVKVVDTTVEVPAAMYCEDGKPVVASDEEGVSPLRVEPGKRVEIDVPRDVADAGWTVQVWTARGDDNGSILPDALITTVPVGKETSFDQITTSDAAPETFYLIVAQSPAKGCPDAGALWPIGFIRTAS